MEQDVKLRCIVLRSRDYKEADQLLTLYSLEQGKLTALAKGVKKTESRLRSGLLLFSHTEVVLTQGRAFPIVTGASAVSAFAALREDFARMSYAGYCAELLDQVIAEGQPDPDLFRLVLETFHLLEHMDPWLAARQLEVRLLRQQGYGLDLWNCLHCGAPLTASLQRGVEGGFLCDTCGRAEPGDCFLSREGLTALRALEALPLHRLGLIRVSRAGRKSLEAYLEFQLRQLLTRPLKSRDFLRQLEL